MYLRDGILCIIEILNNILNKENNNVVNKRGNVFIFSIFLIAIILVILLFTLIIFISQTNSLLYNIKLDMYSINKSAILSVNKGITSREEFSYDEKEFRKYFEKMIKINYGLNDDLENESGLVNRVDIKEYKIYDKGKKDLYTNESLDNIIIHSVITVKIKPIIFEKLLENIFVFDIHEDVILNELKV